MNFLTYRGIQYLIYVSSMAWKHNNILFKIYTIGLQTSTHEAKLQDKPCTYTLKETPDTPSQTSELGSISEYIFRRRRYKTAYIIDQMLILMFLPICVDGADNTRFHELHAYFWNHCLFIYQIINYHFNDGHSNKLMNDFPKTDLLKLEILRLATFNYMKSTDLKLIPSCWVLCHCFTLKIRA